MKEDDVLLSLPQVADALGVSHVTAWRIVVREHLLPSVKVGQNWGVWQSAVDAYKAAPPKRREAGRPRKPRPNE
jgi:predicted DNA-binding transcriptional regulator AlpA